MQAAVINILINLQSKQLGNYGDVKICFPLPLHSTGTDRAFKFLNMPFMFSRALKSLWTVSLLGDAPSSPIPTGRLAILFIQWQEVSGFSLLLQLDSRNLSSLPVRFWPSFIFFYSVTVTRAACVFSVTPSEPSPQPKINFLFCVFWQKQPFFSQFSLSHSYRFIYFLSEMWHFSSWSTNKAFENLPLCALCKRGTPSWGYWMVQLREGRRKRATMPLSQCTVIWAV